MLNLNTAGLQDDAASLWAFREAERAAGLRHDTEQEPVWEVKREAPPEPDPQPEAPVSPGETEAGATEDDYDPAAYAAHDDAPKAEAGAAGPEPEAAAAPDPKPESEPSPGNTAGSGETRRERYVKTDAIKAAVQGHQRDVLRVLGIAWPPAHGDHILCPYRTHDDHEPSWRWDEQKDCAFCSCKNGLSIFDVVMRVEGVDFDAAKIRVAEIINRHDLIVDPNESGVTLAEIAEAKRLPIEVLRDKMGWRDVPRYGKFRRRAVRIPYFDQNDGRWDRFRVKLRGNKDKRFFWEKGHTRAPLYGTWRIPEFQERYVILVEGESDVATCWHHEFAALGLPGAGNWNEERHSPLLDGFAMIFAIIEPDTGREKMLRWLSRSSIRSRVRLVRMSAETKDPSALYLDDPDGFVEAFQAILKAAEPFDPVKHAPRDIDDFSAERRHKQREDRAGPVPLRGLPIIEYAGGRLSSATDEAERIISQSDRELYQRGPFLVRLGFDEEMITADGTMIKGPRLVRVEPMHMQYRLTKHIDFQVYDAREEEHKSINCPPDVARSLLQLQGLWPNIPSIAGITTAPTLRADGSILDQHGYDAATRVLYIKPAGVDYPEIPQEPTKEQARAALDLLCEPIKEYPFIAENGNDATGQPSPSRSVALSGFITPLVRRALATAPLHAFDATAAGSGKSKLVSVASVIARGHEAHVISGTAINPEEFEKKISTVLIAGDAIVAIDNLEGPLGGELLCSATTEAMLSIRVLGVSKAVRVPNSAVFFATGNSMVIVGDMVRRCIRARLDPRVENPELRTFKDGDPVLRAKRDRASLVVAALTVLRAYHVADRPRPSGAPPPLGSFEDWSRLVRDALIWLDQPDPCLTMERAKQDDPRRNALAAVLHTWHAALGEIEVTAKGLIEMAIEQQPGTYNDYNPPAYIQPDLREALIAVAGDRGAFINSTKLGYWLRASKGRVIDRLRIESGIGKDRSGVAVWKVVKV